MLEAALAAGIAAAGGDALLGGVLPTPAAAILVKRLGLDLAAVVSASHNPYRDNGIKFFSRQGRSSATRPRRGSRRCSEASRMRRAAVGRVRELNGGLEDYLRELEAPSRSTSAAAGWCSTAPTAPPTAPPRRSSSGSAPRSRRSPPSPTGATSTTAAAPPTSRAWRARVAGSDAEIGFAFDGDGDRVLAVDGDGRVHDGDELIALAARGMAARGELAGGVVVTVMTNYGFHRAMEEAGIEVAVTQVGDRYVLDEMQRRGWIARRRAVGPHHRHRLRSPPATASPPR